MTAFFFYINLVVYCILPAQAQPPIKVGPFYTHQACERVRAATAHAGPTCIEMTR